MVYIVLMLNLLKQTDNHIFSSFL